MTRKLTTKALGIRAFKAMVEREKKAGRMTPALERAAEFVLLAFAAVPRANSPEYQHQIANVEHYLNEFEKVRARERE